MTNDYFYSYFSVFSKQREKRERVKEIVGEIFVARGIALDSRRTYCSSMFCAKAKVPERGREDAKICAKRSNLIIVQSHSIDVKEELSKEKQQTRFISNTNKQQSCPSVVQHERRALETIVIILILPFMGTGNHTVIIPTMCLP